MIGIPTDELLFRLRRITEDNMTFVSKKCRHLGENQLHWRRTKDSWNILEVLAHLNSLVNFYHPLILNKIKKTKFTTPSDTFVSSQLGRSAWKSIQLGRANNIKRKFRAQRTHNPTILPELVEKNTIEKFEKNQLELLNILDLAKHVNLKKAKVPISFSRIVRLRLGDVLQFVIYHNERHIQQIKNILENKNFPDKVVG
ncbi:MAG: DinB family protein [Brumimicrobium sp.]|nr:DinB family protein [Brumimicrobium sp.]MCO5268783.1 DinB family protein [Brumimicrobium sp.]